MAMYEYMNNGEMNGFICQGFNPLGSAPYKKKITDAMSKHKFLVIIDPLGTATSEFWKHPGEYSDVDARDIQTEVFRLPSHCVVEEARPFTHSRRTLLCE